MKLSIRAGRIEDADSMAAIEALCFSDPWSAESFRQMMEMPVSHTLTVWDEEAEPMLVGYLLLLAIAPEVEIANIAVSPSFRRQGIGRALLEEGIARMRAEGCDRFFLEVREHNLSAQALYSGLGFAQVGRRKNYYQNPREDALLMALLPEEEELTD